MAPPNQLTFRLRKCPASHDEAGVCQLLCDEFSDIQPCDIQLHSLATSLHRFPWETISLRTATLTFQTLPAKIKSGLEEGEDEWRFNANGHVLILDIHFDGMTPMNDIDEDKYEFNCIAISGLGSHPFGSWQAKGRERSFMWIRDTLPQAIPNIRVILYGYDTGLNNSSSFQSVADIASALIEALKILKQSDGLFRPVVFLAHSLGGIVLKEVVAILANSKVYLERAMLKDDFKGGVFFGVPSHGMNINALRTMVHGKPNEHLILDLGEDSDYLRSLDDRFAGISMFLDMKTYWAYETKMSPTVEQQEDGSFARCGPEQILVSRESATRKLYSPDGPRDACVFPIDRNHSEMVKFRDDEAYLRIVCAKLMEICDSPGQRPHRGGAISGRIGPGVTPHRRGDEGLTIKDLIESLKVPERDSRLESIGTNFEQTFSWIFDEKATPFMNWLHARRGIFWIHGKPASGKSTLLKFIYQNSGKRLRELLHDPTSGSVFVQAAFFFHNRGTLLQKSFQGLLRSILSQVLEQEPDLIRCFPGLLEERSELARARRSDHWSENELERCFQILLKQRAVDLELFLVFDALDEYGGKPEYISRFLRGLLDVAPMSRTKLQILFSSRPWDVFLVEFRGAPSLQLQDYTKEDIRLFCVGTIEDGGQRVASLLNPLVSEMVNMAKGVFLWVSLVLRELTSAALGGKTSDELRLILNAIPTDLKDYYTLIIDRIPEELRFDTYVILEIASIDDIYDTWLRWDLAREDDLDVLDLIYILVCSYSRTYGECRDNLLRLGRELFPALLPHISTGAEADSWVRTNIRAMQWQEIGLNSSGVLQGYSSRILRATGGLVELMPMPTSTTRSGSVRFQLAHQTVKEFVRLVTYKKTVLGRRAATVDQNRYSFLAKYFLAMGAGALAGLACQMAEATTGSSQLDMINTVAPDRLSTATWNPAEYKNDPDIRGPVRFAVFHNLRLYLEDSVRSGPNAFRNTDEKILSMCIHQSNDPESYIAAIRLILQNGYDIRKDDELALDETMWECFHRFSTDIQILCSEQKAELMVQHGHDPKIWIPFSNRLTLARENVSVQPLHVASYPFLSRALLDHGPDPNVLDTAGNTPLDHALSLFCPVPHRVTRRLIRSHFQNSGSKYELGLMGQEQQNELYQRICIIIQHGGITKSTVAEVWEASFQFFGTRGFDTAILREAQSVSGSSTLWTNRQWLLGYLGSLPATAGDSRGQNETSEEILPD